MMKYMKLIEDKDEALYIINDLKKDYLKKEDLINHLVNDCGCVIEDTPISKLYVNNELQYDLTPKEEKKIPEKLGYFDLIKDENEKDKNGNDLELHYTGVADTFNDVYKKINEVIDYLDYLKSKGDK